MALTYWVKTLLLFFVFHEQLGITVTDDLFFLIGYLFCSCANVKWSFNEFLKSQQKEKEEVLPG